MRKLILIFSFIGILLTSTSAFASIHGVLAGKVVDAEGKGALGASVFVEGTTRGTTVRNPNGTFTVTNITAGNYTVRVRAVGKQEQRINVRISVDQTTNINVVLKDDAVAMDTVFVTAKGTEAAGKVDKNTIGQINTLSNEELTSQGTSNIASVIGMTAGVSTSNDGFAIRGGRPSETQIRVDGLNVGNQFTGGYGAANQTYFPMISSYATEEVQVITGNFAAQYGDAQGGIVNTVMKTGRTDRYEGHVRWQTQLGFLSGSQKAGVGVTQEDNTFRIHDQGEGAKYLRGGHNEVDFGIGGPIPINEKSTFYITGKTQKAETSAGYDIRDPLGNSMTQLPIGGSWGSNVAGRLKFGITNDISLLLGGQYGYSAAQGVSGWQYNTDPLKDMGMPSIDSVTGQINPVNGKPTANGILQMEGKTIAQNTFVPNIMARINHTLTDRSFYEFTVSMSQNNDETGRKVLGTDQRFLRGFELMQPVDDWVIEGNRWLPAEYVNGRYTGDKVIDWATPVTYSGNSYDGYFNSTWEGRNPFTGYYEGQLYTYATNNPWGLQNAFYSGGASGFDFRYCTILQADGHYNLYNLKTGDFNHVIKGGFETQYFTLNRHFNNAPWSGNPLYDIYTDRWGGNLYADSQSTYDKTSKAFNELKVGMYAQDQITYKGIVISAGLRLDIMDPMSQYRVPQEASTQFVPISSDSGFADASVKSQISPRISINYPITERSYISMSYGQFFQSPYANYLYDRFNAQTISSGDIIGDPNMEAQQTNQYQVSYQNQLTDEVAMSFSVYYKDIYNQLGLIQVLAAPESYFQYAVSEYGSSKGIELDLTKFMSNYFAFGLNYTLSYVIVTSPNETSNQGVYQDPYSGALTFPLAPYYSSSDVRHRVKGYVAFAIPQKDGPTMWNMKPLQNTRLTLQPVWQTGTPYTRMNAAGFEVSEKNTYRQPNYWRMDLVASKSFLLRDWFGESMKRSSIEFFVAINNVFNRREAIAVYSVTGDPLDNGVTFLRTKGDYSATPWYEKATMANPASYTSEQYDKYGYRLYNAAADLDGNGIVTQDEKYAAWRKYVEEVSLQARSAFQVPITVNAGIYINF